MHRRANLRNQDSLQIRDCVKGLGLRVVAVADGHGSSRSPRSELGAAFATAVAVQEVAVLWGELVEDVKEGQVANLEGRWREALPPRLVSGWQRRVENHFRK